MTTLVELDLAPETREELIVMAHEQSDRMRRLIEQLLDLSRLDAQAIRVTPRPIVLGAVVAEIVTGALPPGVEIDVDVPPTSVWSRIRSSSIASSRIR